MLDARKETHDVIRPSANSRSYRPAQNSPPTSRPSERPPSHGGAAMSFNTDVATDSGSPTAVSNELSTPSSDPGVPHALRSSIRILVIDDDRTLREGCASVLQVEGYNVTTSGRGDEAIEIVRRSQFDVVLVDLYMTPVSGMEILKTVVTTRPEAIVVMM